MLVLLLWQYNRKSESKKLVNHSQGRRYWGVGGGGVSHPPKILKNRGNSGKIRENSGKIMENSVTSGNICGC